MSLVAGLSPRRPGFAPGSIHVGFVVDKVLLGQSFLRVFRFSSVNISFHSVFYTVPKGCGFEHGQDDGFFKGDKNPQHTFVSDG
jgi:hypothetical protein